jgi:hypothetical protein
MSTSNTVESSAQSQQNATEESSDEQHVCKWYVLPNTSPPGL